MIKIENVDVYNFKGAFRGMRNPFNSWEKSDSDFGWDYPTIGENDIELAKSMVRAGTDESKFLRQIFVSFDLTAPLYLWKEFDTYKVGTVANSCSTMHTLTKTPITKANFSLDHPDAAVTDLPLDDYIRLTSELSSLINTCEWLRQRFNETKDTRYWRALIQMLPESFNQKRTITLNYQVLRAQYFARKHHRLSEWRDYCKWIETLPYAKDLICYKI